MDTNLPQPPGNMPKQLMHSQDVSSTTTNGGTAGARRRLDSDKDTSLHLHKTLHEMSNHTLPQPLPVETTTNYTTTLFFLVVIHFVFIKQWCFSTRTSRRKVVVNYHGIIQRKQYHTAVGALLSHPPMPSTNRTTTNRPDMMEGSQPPRITSLPSFLAFCSWRWNALVRRIRGHPWSGLPLLFYNAHLLWSCRALEVFVTIPNTGATPATTTTATMPHINGWDYARVLWGLTLVGVLLDFGFTHTVLSILRDMNHATSSSFAMGARYWNNNNSSSSTVVRRVERLLVQRSMASCTMTTSAVLVVFREAFPLESIPLLPPLFSWLDTANWPIFSLPAVSHALAMVLLLVLAHPTHPMAAVLAGSMSGVLWTAGVTSFLQESYWCYGSLLVYAAACALSLKVKYPSYLTCIDAVGWDARGRLIGDGQEDSTGLSSASNADSESDSDVEAHGGRDSTRRTANTSMPLLIPSGLEDDAFDSDADGDDGIVERTTSHSTDNSDTTSGLLSRNARSTAIRSRRGPSVSRV